MLEVTELVERGIDRDKEEKSNEIRYADKTLHLEELGKSVCLGERSS